MAPEDKVLVDPRRCPLCGKSNECGMESGQGTGKAACWCFTRTIPESVLEQIPADARDQACVCSACASSRAR
ncbi:MAG: cysteine-rich CWC family protein [Gammaproteobacteria bacterium]